MKLSKYNRFFKSREKWVVYNSFTSSLTELEDSLYNHLFNNEFEKISEEDLIELEKLKIVIKNDDVLLNKLKFEIFKSRYDQDNMHLTITPTYACNFSCSYCYEKSRPNVYMSEETEQNLIFFVKDRQINSLKVTWYGGEPLLAFDRIIRLSSKFKRYSKFYSAHIVTNGYSLTMDKIIKLKELNIEEIQITIDGTKEIHDNKRPLKNGAGTFSKIIENISDVLNNTNIRVIVRVNIDKTNSDYFHVLQDFIINKKFKEKNIAIYPAMIHDFDDNSSCRTSAGCLLDKNNYSKFILEQFYKHKNTNIEYFPPAPDIECMAKHINAFLIGADGDIYKCWLDIGDKTKRIGNLNDSSIKNYDILAKYMVGADVFEDKKCKDCILLPNCIGGCPNERIASINNKQIDYCTPMIKDLESFLKIQYLIETGSNIETDNDLK